jgi:hypothetical protein
VFSVLALDVVPAGDVAALVTAFGMSVAAIITAIAALRNANANAKRVDDLIKENEQLHAENNAKTKHNEYQDAIILEQHVKIEKWHEWGMHIGRVMNQMQLQIGLFSQRSVDDTLPLRVPQLPDTHTDDEP